MDNHLGIVLLRIKQKRKRTACGTAALWERLDRSTIITSARSRTVRAYNVSNAYTKHRTHVTTAHNEETTVHRAKRNGEQALPGDGLGPGSVTHHQRERRAPFKRSLLPPGSAPLKWTSTGTSAWRARRVDLTRLASAATTGAATRARVPRVGTAAESFPVRRAACVSMDAAALLG